jgi:hypothetical protein
VAFLEVKGSRVPKQGRSSCCHSWRRSSQNRRRFCSRYVAVLAPEALVARAHPRRRVSSFIMSAECETADVCATSRQGETAQVQATGRAMAPGRCNRTGHPAVAVEVEQPVVRMATENPTWGYTRRVGARDNLGHQEARAATVAAGGVVHVPVRAVDRPGSNRSNTADSGPHHTGSTRPRRRPRGRNRPAAW